jgi:hypothetical protein
VTEILSPGGDRKIAAAECLGFTIAANEEDVVFAGDATVTLGCMQVPVELVDETHLRAGSEETGGACFFLPVFPAELGDLALTVTSAGQSWQLDDAFEILPVEAFDVGLVAKDRVWSRDVVSDDGANVFEHAWDVDVYRVTFSDEYHVYDDVDFFPLDDPGLVPELQLWSDRFPDAYLGRGGVGLVFPQSGEQLVVVRDANGRGGTNGAYELGFVGDELGSVDPADSCQGAPFIGSRAIHADYDELQDDFDPDGSCTDSIYGTPIVGRGRDAVWRVAVPAHAELRVSSYDDHVNAVLWIMDPAGGCPRKPVCLAAAGRFGGGNTDTLVWVNSGAAEREMLLVHDAEREPELEEGEDEIGSFLLDVEIFEDP